MTPPRPCSGHVTLELHGLAGRRIALHDVMRRRDLRTRWQRCPACRASALASARLYRYDHGSLEWVTTSGSDCARSPTTRTAGGAGGRTSATAPGPRSARTTAPTATPGTTSPTTWRAARPIAGARTASPASATATSSSCFAPAFWNGRDPILKERLFGLTPHEGNHGEDVKEYYFYLDNTPTHSYMKFLYKYPQRRVPLRPARRGEPPRAAASGSEFELLDTGIFDDDRYFDIFVEYAKADPEDICIRIEAFNRGPEPAPLHILPHLWFRNTWAWGARRRGRSRRSAPGPSGRATSAWSPTTRDGRDARDDPDRVPARPALRCTRRPAARRCSPTTRPTCARVFGPGNATASRYVKDAFHRYVVDGETTRVNPDEVGTKAALHYRFDAVRAGGSVVAPAAPDRRASLRDPLAERRRRSSTRAGRGRRVLRGDPSARARPTTRSSSSGRRSPACSGRKQSYLFDVDVWLDGDNPDWPPPRVAQDDPQRALAAPQLDARA